MRTRISKEKVTLEHLYTPADVKRVRELLYKEQDGKDALTQLELPIDKLCLDHNHSTQYVRGVLHRQINCALGKLEGVHTRYLSYWYSGSLPDFLRQAADYLERGDDNRYIHPGFLKKLSSLYNSLNESSKKEVLQYMNQPQGANAAERKKEFKKALMSRSFSFAEIRDLIQEKKG